MKAVTSTGTAVLFRVSNKYRYRGTFKNNITCPPLQHVDKLGRSCNRVFKLIATVNKQLIAYFGQKN